MNNTVNVMPTKSELMTAIITELATFGGSAKTSEIDAKVANKLNLSEELLALEDDGSTGTVFSYKMRWARTEFVRKG